MKIYRCNILYAVYFCWIPRFISLSTWSLTSSSHSYQVTLAMKVSRTLQLAFGTPCRPSDMSAEVSAKRVSLTPDTNLALRQHD